MKNMEPYKIIKKLVEERDLAIKQLNSIGVGLGDNMDHIKNALEQRWIPCSERMPEEYGEYLCTLQGEHDNGTAQQCGFIPKSMIGLIPGWSTCDADGFVRLRDEEVVAWMPLPEPYKDGE